MNWRLLEVLSVKIIKQSRAIQGSGYNFESSGRTVAAKDMNLLVNQDKTKYMPVTKRSHTHYPHYLEVGS
jgi:hypothetical protein